MSHEAGILLNSSKANDALIQRVKAYASGRPWISISAAMAELLSIGLETVQRDAEILEKARRRGSLAMERINRRAEESAHQTTLEEAIRDASEG